MMNVICILLLVFQFVFLLRMVLSFFPLREQTLAATAREVSMAVTEPIVFPIRRALPPLPGVFAGFGVAEILVLIGVQIISQIICRLV